VAQHLAERSSLYLTLRRAQRPAAAHSWPVEGDARFGNKQLFAAKPVVVLAIAATMSEHPYSPRSLVSGGAGFAALGQVLGGANAQHRRREYVAGGIADGD
jgi:hypothetical protein